MYLNWRVKLALMINRYLTYSGIEIPTVMLIDKQSIKWNEAYKVIQMNIKPITRCIIQGIKAMVALVETWQSWQMNKFKIK